TRLRGGPCVVGFGADGIGEDDFIDKANRNTQESLKDRYELLGAWNRENADDAAHQPGDGAQHALDQLIDPEQYAGLGEAFRHLLAGIGDLRTPLRHLFAVEQLDQHRDMPRLDDIENIFARQVHDDAHEPEPDHAAPYRRTRLKAGIAEPADAPAEDRKSVGEGTRGAR